MRFFLVVILFISFNNYGQNEINQPFTSKVLLFSGLGVDFSKKEGDVLVEAYNINVADSGSYYRCDGYPKDSAFVVFGTTRGNDTINKTRYDFHFLPCPDPKFTWDLEYDRKTIILHKDSLDSLQNLRVVWPKYLPRKQRVEILKSTLFWPGMTGRPPSFEGPRIPDSIAYRMTSNKDTLQLSMTSTIRTEDKINRQIGAFIQVILLEGEAYERAIDPLYDYHLFSDTTELTWNDFKNDDTLTLNIRKGHLFIWFPREKEDYWVDFEKEIVPGEPSYSYDPPPIRVPAGKGKYLLDAKLKSELYNVQILNNEYRVIKSKNIYFKIIESP